MNKRKHLDKVKREEIEILLARGYKQYEIARVLKVNKSTISRELQRVKRAGYCAESSENHASKRRLRSKYQGMKLQGDDVLRAKVIEALKERQSPEAIAGRIGGISHVSIYEWLRSPWGQKYCKYLCSKKHRKKKHKKNKTKRVMIPNAASIHERPTEGVHWEGDLFVSPTKLDHSVSVAILVEPESQYLLAIKIPNRKASTMLKVVKELIQKIQVTDITWDRGIENKYHQELPVPSYFCGPRAPWQKPHVENNIGLLRKWFVPKGTDLNLYEQKDLDRHIYILNHKWRKSLNYRSAYEVAMENGILK